MSLSLFLSLVDEEHPFLGFRRVSEEDQEERQSSNSGAVYTLEPGVWRHHSCMTHTQALHPM